MAVLAFYQIEFVTAVENKTSQLKIKVNEYIQYIITQQNHPLFSI
jgi:hypothetical protein